MIPRVSLVFLLLSGTCLLFGQNKHFTLGLKDNGICFGNSAYFNGLRLNLWDRNTRQMNGLNISGLTNFGKSNGISIGIIGAADTLANGIEIGGLAFAGRNLNGLAVGPVVHADRINGVGVGILTVTDTLNGFFVGIIALGATSSYKGLIKGLVLGTAVISYEIRGVSVGTAGSEFHTVHGVTIGFYNSAKELHGLELGLINHAGNNKGLFKWTPILNFHFGK